MKFMITVTVPEGKMPGDTFDVEVEAPVKERKPRGQLAGIPIEEMTDEQLKRELINANSVLYKAKQRNAPDDIIAKNEARVEAAKAEKAKRAPVAAEATAVEDDGIYDEETQQEI